MIADDTRVTQRAVSLYMQAVDPYCQERQERNLCGFYALAEISASFDKIVLFASNYVIVCLDLHSRVSQKSAEDVQTIMHVFCSITIIKMKLLPALTQFPNVGTSAMADFFDSQNLATLLGSYNVIDEKPLYKEFFARRGKFVPPIPYHLPRIADHVYTSLAARRLPKFGQVFCWVQTSSLYHETRVLAINETWLPRCDHGEFFTDHNFSSENIAYSTVFAGFPDSYWTLFYKTRYAFYYIYNYVSKDFEWYLRADDDTYIVMEHLKGYLSMLDHNEPYYLGYVLKPRVEHGYNTGGSGYVLSKKALQIYNDFLYHNETLCPNSLAEDRMMARCLANVGIFPHDTRNSLGQNRFNAFTPYDVFYATHYHPNWTYFPEKRGYEGFAADFISFHHLKPDEIRLFDILLYRTNRSNKTISTS